MEHYDWKASIKTCSECDWSGLGQDAEIGETFADGAEYHCPKCNHYFGYIAYPTLEQSRTDSRAPEVDRMFAKIVADRERKARSN